jgi:hypothetical protein
MFTWNNKQYQFKSLPQGYKNSPIIAHVTLQWSLDKLKIPDECLVLSYVDDIIIAGKSKEKVSKLPEETVEILRKDGWTINPNKIQNPQDSVKFLGVIWTVTGPKVPDPVLDKIANLKAPTNKMEAQQTIGLFGYWRNHIPYLQVLLQPLYQVIKKGSDFEWGPQQEHAFKVVKELIATHSQLYTIARTDTVILDISYQTGYGNWGIMCKQGTHTVPVSFYCKRFPYVESKYAIFEILTWTLMEAVKTLCLVLMDQCLVIRSPVSILDWINM